MLEGTKNLRIAPFPRLPRVHKTYLGMQWTHPKPLLPSLWHVWWLLVMDLPQHTNTLIDLTPLSPHQTHPHRPHHVVDRGLAAPKNPRLAGTEDQGLVERRPRYVATRSRHSGGGNQCVSHALVCKYVPMRVEAREVDCSPCTVPVGWPQPDCPARRPSAEPRARSAHPLPLPHAHPPLQAGNFTWEKWWATNQRKARFRWFTMTRHSSGRRGKRSR